MGKTFPCTAPDCDRVFTRAYELRKHKATHEDPNSVFHCSRCDFITLQKKNLGIHFAIHTGEKNYECPDMVSVGASKQHCDYRTNDPAALSKHRKKVHAYIPPPNRSRPRPTPAPRKSQQKKDEKIPRRRRRARITLAPRRKASRSPRKARNSNSGSGNTITSISLFCMDGNAMHLNCDEDSGYDSSNVTLINTDDEIGLDTLFDPSLRCEWMAKYEMSYDSFDMTGMQRELETLPEDLSLDQAALDVQTGREGCLCPEWMVEAGIEGWDESVVEAHKKYFAIHA